MRKRKCVSRDKKCSCRTFVIAFFLLLLFSRTYPAKAEEDIYLVSGENKVIPCLQEIWSDQEFHVEISNPAIVQTDPSGKAVTGLQEGETGLRVFLTNPLRTYTYTIIVRNPAALSPLPENTAGLPPEATVSGISAETEASAGDEASAGTSVLPEETAAASRAETETAAQEQDVQEQTGASSPKAAEVFPDTGIRLPAAGIAFAHGNTFHDILVPDSYSLRIFLQSSAGVKILSVLLNGRPAAYDYADGEMNVSSRTSERGKNILTLSAADIHGKIYSMEPWIFFRE